MATRARPGPQRAAAPSARPDLVLASAHGTPLDALERAALAAAGVGDAPIIAPKSSLGDAFGASSALATAMAPYLDAERVLVSAICPAGSVGALLHRAGRVSGLVRRAVPPRDSQWRAPLRRACS